jgi:hypothetical protein
MRLNNASFETKALTLAVLFSSLILCAANIPQVRLASLGRANLQAAPHFEVRRDPLPGFKVPLPSSDVGGRPIVCPGRNIVLVSVGPCQSCSARRLDTARLARVRSAQVVLLVSGSKQEARSFATSAGKSLLCVVDDRDLTKQLNADYFSPRAFLIHSNGSLVRCQAYGESLEAFLGGVL